jgi:hypothetical protein
MVLEERSHNHCLGIEFPYFLIHRILKVAKVVVVVEVVVVSFI